uniref:Uncharacterized protein n=1 Tax=Klebsiella pneumoniae TaxID=573 RepID=A0A6G9HZG1_KLEPN|nr:hypothetical protein [Klebsiella pneumoniae]
MSTIHLITTCAKRKAGPVHDTVFPYHTTDTEIAYQQWKSLVQSRFTTCNDDIKETENIYCSAHWSLVMVWDIKKYWISKVTSCLLSKCAISFRMFLMQI